MPFISSLFTFEIYMFFVLTFGYVGKLVDKKAMVNFKIYEVTDWTRNNCNTNVSQYLKK